jgi:hypothetical protein
MILLSYIILGHSDWKHGEIKIFAVFPEDEIDRESARLFELIKAGQLPISQNGIQVLTRKSDIEIRSIIREKSQDAGLTVVGFRSETIKKYGTEVFENWNLPGDVLFVNAAEEKEIK